MNAAIYARYSSDNQREESIDAQIRAIKEYADKNGIIITKVYTDEARSATTDNRPKFLEMIKDILLLYKSIVNLIAPDVSINIKRFVKSNNNNLETINPFSLGYNLCKKTRLDFIVDSNFYQIGGNNDN